ncbi:MAG: class I SAM-dependent rRNA methyltransferase [Candidatus Omnitrophica bacterium]|nr:class I SAM-dependent rRNA methyltransferase [Candidatus Omnitrophota bacterium]
MEKEKKVILKKGPGAQNALWHPWIYRSQIGEISGSPSPGDRLSVYGPHKRFIGAGTFNPKSEIVVRILSRTPAPWDKSFFKERIGAAMEHRARWVTDTNACRVVAGEADGLPGLIVDRYDEVLVVQFLTMGMEKLKGAVLEALGEAIPNRGIYEKSDSVSRKWEGLEPRTGWIQKDCGDEATVREGGVRYKINFGEGHKTGLYLDQRENRFLLANLGIKGDALDAFCYQGGFGLHLALGGCRVLGIDIQESAIKEAKANRDLNGIPPEKMDFRTANVFDELKALQKEGRRFDLVILDPPSFVKKKSALEGAAAGYKEILLRAMKLLNEKGCLAVFACSHHVDENLLMQCSLSAAHDVRKDLRVLKFMKQSADHPINPFIPETYYLKGFLFSVSSQ